MFLHSPDWKTWQVSTRSRRGSSHNLGRNRGRIEKSRGRDEKKMGNGLPLGQLFHLGTRIGLRRVSQHPGSGQNLVCPENLVELPATFCRLVHSWRLLLTQPGWGLWWIIGSTVPTLVPYLISIFKHHIDYDTVVPWLEDCSQLLFLV